MSEHFFGVGKRSVPRALAKRIARIASEHGADFTSFPPGDRGIPGSETRYWFSCENRGEPFDRNTAAAVLAAIKAAGIELP